MEWTQMMQQAIDYMEQHIMEQISYEDVARQVHMSGYEFHRAFSYLADMTATAYLRNRRLSLAGQELQRSEEKVIDIALKYGYDTPESFSKAFTRFHGVSPKYAKRPGTQLCLFQPLVIKITMEGGRKMNYRMEQLEAQKFAAMVRSFSNENINEEGNHEISDFWSQCLDKKLTEPLLTLRPEGKRDLYGLCSPTVRGENTFDYGIGIMLDSETKQISEDTLRKAGYQIWTVEPQTYVVFDCI